ncbi:MAG TPA: RsmG family class I SAM-dependent methyltransferase, partial [Ferruginibacter sp.]|nr:RsmG family class I SAM-dependent methyltransferase [Ferruginibacter sp.]
TEFVLVDSIKKKLGVSKQIATETGLQNIITRHSRAEDIKDRKFDVITSRAVAPLKDLWQWSKPLLNKNKNSETRIPNGLICLKGGDLNIEIQESGCKPYIWDINTFFREDYFQLKYILYQPALK